MRESREGTESDVVNGKIEVTPEMERAGFRVLVSFDPEFESAAEVAKEVYIAMERVKARGKSRVQKVVNAP
jgi:hypothetical protein